MELTSFMRSPTRQGKRVLVLALSGDVLKFIASAKANSINNRVHASEHVWPPLTVAHCQYEGVFLTLVPTSNVEEIHAGDAYGIPRALSLPLAVGSPKTSNQRLKSEDWSF